MAMNANVVIGDARTKVRRQQPEQEYFIQLTKWEDYIFRLLLDVARSHRFKTGQQVDLRVTGGWVRDKLTRRAPRDIDISVDGMLGYDFAKLVNTHLASIGEFQKRIFRTESRGMATMMFWHLQLDFVHLQSHDNRYLSHTSGEDDFASPYEDAIRRDFTINALFFNLQNETIEDYTGKGLSDLRKSIIRTPLKAYQTFWQDPLRVLRCIRFASQDEFRIDEDAYSAMLDPNIQETLRTKVSVPRLGAELTSIFNQHAHRLKAMAMFRELDLYNTILAPPEINVLAKGTSAVKGTRHDIEAAFKLIWIMEWLLRVHPLECTSGNNIDDGSDEALKKLVRRTRELEIASHIQSSLRRRVPSMVETTYDSDGVLVDNRSGAPYTDEDGINPETVMSRTIQTAFFYPYRDMTATVNGNVISAVKWLSLFRATIRKKDLAWMTRVLRYYKAGQAAVNSIALEMPAVEDTEQRRKEKATIGTFILKVFSAPKDKFFGSAEDNCWPSIILFGLGVELIPQYEQLRLGILNDTTKTTIEKYNVFLSKAEEYGVHKCYLWECMLEASYY
ncbi:hypothetical protein EDD11_005219 [Mortierella claussenii]|nr:hypothetical protein EDD11_005219 [Mortierella claussenii]